MTSSRLENCSGRGNLSSRSWPPSSGQCSSKKKIAKSRTFPRDGLMPALLAREGGENAFDDAGAEAQKGKRCHRSLPSSFSDHRERAITLLPLLPATLPLVTDQ